MYLVQYLESQSPIACTNTRISWAQILLVRNVLPSQDRVNQYVVTVSFNFKLNESPLACQQGPNKLWRAWLVNSEVQDDGILAVNIPACGATVERCRQGVHFPIVDGKTNHVFSGLVLLLDIFLLHVVLA